MNNSRKRVCPFTEDYEEYYESIDQDLDSEWEEYYHPPQYRPRSPQGERNFLFRSSETPVNFPFNDFSPDLAAEVATQYPDFGPIEIPLNYCPPPMSENREPSRLAAQGASAHRPERPHSLHEANLPSRRAYLASASQVMASRAHVQHMQQQHQALKEYVAYLQRELADQEEAYAEALTAQALVLLSQPDALVAAQQQNAQAFAEQQYYGGFQHTIAQQSALSAHPPGSRRSQHRQIARQTARQHQARQRAQQQARQQAALQAVNEHLAQQNAQQQQLVHQSVHHQQNEAAQHQNGTSMGNGNPQHQGQGHSQDQH